MEKKLIWDLPTRLFHWLLAASLIGQYVTAEWVENALEWHFYIGYFVMGLLFFRISWGFTGPRYARFSQFLAGPDKIKAYLSDTDNAKARNPGHNPLGGWSVIAMLILLLAQSISGLFMTDDILWDGPFYHMVGSDVQGVASWIHHNIFNILLGVIALHIVAVLYYSLLKKQPLISAMIHGKKPTHATAINSSMLVKAIVISGAVASIVYWLVTSAETW
ncbi:cytochrome b/b6 domain-containing protein [Alteromonas sp. ASW11-130]|uniref:cytochrome b/b6 domain-containing protein n=1 Tax=Alteromonas sp. ASW11-130 TaxID=3015775 RepID=UPI0022421B7D|nr:cytochrome b/b6 domain-containing protein [Alteromonas sp. ASW11-130]MCW8091440.1 cytochrome b/b6 domain-containing protein [Alteromonas sp. ASW11-130]